MSTTTAGRRRLYLATAGPAATLAAIACLAAAGPATALAAVAHRAAASHPATRPAPGPFGLTPTPTRAGLPRPYFRLTLRPGGSATETALLSNEGKTTELLRVTRSRGVTAANSGSAFENVTGRCGGADCWLRGLPVVVSLAPGHGHVLGFRVHVPAWTRPGQYLAGLTAESAIRPRPVRVGSNGRASARAIIIDQVTVGVAITVQGHARLRTAVAIPAVTGGWVGTTPRLYIAVRNIGQTFATARGRVTCRAGGRSRSYRVIMETVLPAGRAVLPVNAPGLRSGPVPCAVRLRDSAGHLIGWSGTVALPALQQTRTYHLEKGVYVSLPRGTMPPWAIALIVIGALILLVLSALLVRRLRAPRLAP